MTRTKPSKLHPDLPDICPDCGNNVWVMEVSRDKVLLWCERLGLTCTWGKSYLATDLRPRGGQTNEA